MTLKEALSKIHLHFPELFDSKRYDDLEKAVKENYPNLTFKRSTMEREARDFKWGNKLERKRMRELERLKNCPFLQMPKLNQTP